MSEDQWIICMVILSVPLSALATFITVTTLATLIDAVVSWRVK